MPDETPPKTRLFVALSLPEDVRARLPDPGDGWRRLPPGFLHVTLAFLGWRAEADIERVAAALSDPLPPVGPLAVDAVVLLPPRRPRVMAVRLEGEIDALQAEVAARLEAAGVYVRERRPFLAHVTIGRAKGRVPRATPEAPRLSFRPEAVVLYRSRLSAAGARYEALASWPVMAPR